MNQTFRVQDDVCHDMSPLASDLPSSTHKYLSERSPKIRDTGMNFIDLIALMGEEAIA